MSESQTKHIENVEHHPDCPDEEWEYISEWSTGSLTVKSPLDREQLKTRDDLYNSVSVIDRRVDDCYKEMKPISHSQEETGKRFQEFVKIQCGINDRLTGNIGDVFNSLTEMKTLQSVTNAELSKAIEKQREELFSMINSFQSVVEDLSRFQRVQKRVNKDICNNLIQKQNNIAEISSKAQETVDDKLKGTLDSIYTVQNHLNTKLREFEEVDAARVAAVEVLKKDLATLQGRVETMELRCQDIDSYFRI